MNLSDSRILVIGGAGFVGSHIVDRPEAIQALVRAGAELHARDHAGNTPLDLARQAKQQSAARELLALAADSVNGKP